MVTSITALGRSGLHDWFLQRLTGIVLTAYILYLTGFVLTSESIEFAAWRDLFAQPWFKLFSLMSIACMSLHGWIGIWVIATDYFKNFVFRFIFQSLVILSCFAFIIWGAQILWSV